MCLEKNVMIYSPNMEAHRQIYCANLLDYLIHKGCKVYLMTAGFAGKSWEKVTNNIYLSEYLKNPKVKLIKMYTSKYQGNPPKQLKLILDLQAKYNVDYTIFAYADNLNSELIKLSTTPWKKLRGKNYGIFLISTNYIYMEPYCYVEKSVLAQILKGLKSHMIYRKSNLKTVFFLNVVMKYFKIFDRCFFLDENFVRKHRHKRFCYLPDPFKPFEDMSRVMSNNEVAQAKKSYFEFLRRHNNKDIILYFGEEQYRHGMDYLLQLVDQCQDLVYVHFGKTNYGSFNDKKSNLIKRRLNRECRIFEIDHWIADQRIIDFVFQSVKYVLLPYKNHYGSSGMMLEALSYGKPVLVPDVGLMSIRVINHYLGRTFKHLSYDSFYAEFIRLRNEYRIYADTAMQYFTNNFSQERINMALDKMGI